MEMDQGERHEWVAAYEADPRLRTALQELRQGQRKDDFILTPSGLIGIKKHGHTKIVVPSSLRQKILKECHDSPSVGHVGMRRTLEQVDRQFHWHGLSRGGHPDPLIADGGRRPLISVNLADLASLLLTWCGW